MYKWLPQNLHICGLTKVHARMHTHKHTYMLTSAPTHTNTHSLLTNSLYLKSLESQYTFMNSLMHACTHTNTQKNSFIYATCQLNDNIFFFMIANPVFLCAHRLTLWYIYKSLFDNAEYNTFVQESYLQCNWFLLYWSPKLRAEREIWRIIHRPAPSRSVEQEPLGKRSSADDTPLVSDFTLLWTVDTGKRHNKHT